MLMTWVQLPPPPLQVVYFQYLTDKPLRASLLRRLTRLRHVLRINRTLAVRKLNIQVG